MKRKAAYFKNKILNQTFFNQRKSHKKKSGPIKAEQWN